MTSSTTATFRPPSPRSTARTVPAAPRPTRRPDRPVGPRRLPRRGGAGCVVAAYPTRSMAGRPQVQRRVTRLTRRGVLAVTAGTGAVAAVLVWAAWLSAPSNDVRSAAPATVTVQPGDTLWSVATAVAPNLDPRAEVAQLQRLNHLHGVQLAVGQVLRTR